MNPEKREELQRLVKGLVHSEMRLLEQFFTKRVMLMLAAADEITHEPRSVPQLDDDIVLRALEAAEPEESWRTPELGFPSLDYKMKQYRRALEAVWPSSGQNCDGRTK